MPELKTFQPNNPAAGNETVPQVTITVGEVSKDGDTSKYKVSETAAENFGDYRVICRYENDALTYVVPVTSPNGFLGSSCAFCQLAAPTMILVADWTAERSLKPPRIPNPSAMPAGWVLLDRVFEPGVIELSPNGQTPVYRISGVYVYGLSNPHPLGTPDVTYPKPPWLDASIGVPRTIDLDDLDAEVIFTGVSTTAGLKTAPGAN